MSKLSECLQKAERRHNAQGIGHHIGLGVALQKYGVRTLGGVQRNRQGKELPKTIECQRHGSCIQVRPQKVDAVVVQTGKARTGHNEIGVGTLGSILRTKYQKLSEQLIRGADEPGDRWSSSPWRPQYPRRLCLS